ncbi:MAG: polysaccharide biosynthesis/export family protein [Candidatus Eisenbacteria bacterium]
MRRNDLLFFAILSLILGCSSAPPPGEVTGSRPAEGYREKEVAISSLTLGVGDQIEITVWRNPEFDGTYTIEGQGDIFIPIVGPVHAYDLTPMELREEIVEALSEYLVAPHVRVTITAYRSRKVYVLGEVQKPGLYNMGGELATLIGAIAKAGGFTDEANSNKVFLIRDGLDQGRREVYNVDRLMDKGDISQNPELVRGDIIYVPSSFVANVDLFFNHLQTMLNPIVTLERGIILEPAVEDVMKGEEQPGVTVIIPK